jgi:hypothetical protein
MFKGDLTGNSFFILLIKILAKCGLQVKDSVSGKQRGGNNNL